MDIKDDISLVQEELRDFITFMADEHHIPPALVCATMAEFGYEAIQQAMINKEIPVPEGVVSALDSVGEVAKNIAPLVQQQYLLLRTEGTA